MFSKFPSNLYWRKRKISGFFLLNSCLLIKIQNEPFSYRDVKSFRFWTKNVAFGYFKHILMLRFAKVIFIYHINTVEFIKVQMLKSYCHIWNQHPRICLNANFHFKFGTKVAVFGYFRAILKSLLLKSELPDLSKCKVSSKNWIFRLKSFLKAIITFEMSTLKFTKLQSFVQNKKS